MAEIVGPTFNICGEVPFTAKVIKTAQNDYVRFPFPGIRPSSIKARLVTGAVEDVVFPTLTINNASTAYTAEDSELAYDGADAGQRGGGGYYVATASGEIILVIEDDGAAGVAGNVKVIRGCLGTEPSATGLADGDTLYVLSTAVLAGTGTGVVFIEGVPLPGDIGAAIYEE